MRKDSANLKNKLIPVADDLSKINIKGGGYVSAGFPSEAYNYFEKLLDLNEYLISNKKTTLCLWAFEHGQTGEGIVQGDLLVIDTANKATKSNIQLFWIDDAFSLGRIEKRHDETQVIFLNEDIKPVNLSANEILKSYGTLRFAVKKFSVYDRLLAGFPDEAYEYAVKGIDFNDYLIDFWETTFYLWAGGNSMNGDGINKGDLLLVDKLKDSGKNDILVFYLNNQFTLKRIVEHKSHNELVASNPEMPVIRLKKDEEVFQWGVLTASIKKF